jgi:predicted short-subunit dehydrogenase-like oxidoreductase (DUF2520 family)
MITHITIIGKGRVGESVGKVLGTRYEGPGTRDEGQGTGDQMTLNVETLSAREFLHGTRAIVFSTSYLVPSTLSLVPSPSYLVPSPSSSIFLLACKDAFLPAVIQRLAEQYGERLAGSLVMHVNGSLGTDILEPLRACGARIAAAHPFQTFGSVDPSALNGIGWGVECDDDAWPLTEEFVKLTGGFPFRLPKTDPVSKRRYHAAAVAASNFTYAAYDLARGLANEAGIPVETFLVPIMQRTLDNAAKAMHDGTPFALTGPLVRGDMDAVQRQLDAMPEHLREQYIHLTDALKEVIKRVPNIV